MANLITLPQFADERGVLVVLDRISSLLPFQIERIFYIKADHDALRGGHRHHDTIQAAICINGSCVIYNDNNKTVKEYLLDSPDKCLILETSDWHVMHSFTPDAILLVLASTAFDPADYIYEPYNKVANVTI